MFAFRRNPSLKLYKRLLATYVWRYRSRMVKAVICMLLVAGTTAAQAWIIQPVLDYIFVAKNTTYLMLLPLLLISIAIVNGAADYGQLIMLRFVGNRVVSDMQGDLFEHLMHADITLFHDQSSGRLISRLTNDILLMRQSVSQVVTGMVKEICTMAFLLALMFWQSATLSVLAFGILLFGILPIIRLGKRMRSISTDTQVQLGDFTSQLEDTFQGVRVVKAYGREAFEAERARSTINQLFRLYYKATKIYSLTSPLIGVLSGVAIAVIIWYGGSKVIDGQTTAGAFFSFIVAMTMAYRPAKAIAGLNTQLQEGMAAAERFFAVMDTKPNVADASDAAPLKATSGNIAFESVAFHYAEGSGGVQHVSFAVPAGKTVALVGASGAGKTTLMNLLLRFYDPQSGRITIDGQDIRSVTLASLRSALAFVSQEVVLFNDTVRANIAYGNRDATDDDIIAAAKKAYAHEFILSLPEGYNTPIGPLGVKLSGGQRQRLSIARAVLKNAPILLLDEATSALDTASERAVQEALTALMHGRTTLVIAHRLSTIQHADTILVLEGGKIAASGSHTELLASSAIYRNLHHLQAPPEEA